MTTYKKRVLKHSCVYCDIPLEVDYLKRACVICREKKKKYNNKDKNNHINKLIPDKINTYNKLGVVISRIDNDKEIVKDRNIYI